VHKHLVAIILYIAIPFRLPDALTATVAARIFGHSSPIINHAHEIKYHTAVLKLLISEELNALDNDHPARLECGDQHS